MKYILLSILSVILISGCSSVENRKKTGWDISGLQGKVKSTKEVVYKAMDKFGEITKTDETTEIYTLFNEIGNKMEWTTFKPDGSIETKWLYEYDNNGKLLNENCYCPDSLFTKSVHQYDEKSNDIQNATYLSNGDLIFKFIFKYDNNGYKIEGNSYGADGKHINRYVHKYNESGNKIEWIEYSLSNINEKRTFKYDSHNNEIERNIYNSDGSLRDNFIYEYMYDNKFNWTKKIEYKNHIASTITERNIIYFI